MQALFGRRKASKAGSDAKFFSSSKKGEVGELKAELASTDLHVKKDAVKKVIAGLTVGKDMSGVFMDVLNCIKMDNLEVKKLVYLYLINYAKSNPDLAILAVNAFVTDASHHNPLIRALAVRTMGCIRVERITEYLDGPLKKALSDEDPYVRKTAAICVAKLHDISPSLVRDHGFLTLLQELLNDPNPTVVANAVAALSEIQLSYPSHTIFDIPPTTLQKLLAALNECTEWGQVYILDALAQLYTPADAREAETIIERVLPRLAHQNSAVVLSAVKIVLLYMESIGGEEALASYRRKLAPPLVTLAQSPQPEIQYVALRNISLVVQKEPFLLTNKIKVFFCKYNDPIYVKMEKLEILVQLVNDRNVENVLSELKEYATQVDVEYVRRAVRTIGRCAIKLEKAAEKCLQVLLTLIDTKVNYVVQEAIVVIKDIFRKYPNRYEAVISALCDNLESLDEPEAKASMIWIIGEYAARIENADDLLDAFVDGFHDEPAQVQLALLTAVVKLFLVNPEAEDLVEAVLAMAAEESDNPDLRDRGYIYWRLLTADRDAAKAVVLAEKPVIHDDTNVFGRELLGELISNLSSLASVFHKPPDSFVKRRDAGTFEEEEDDDEEELYYEEDGGSPSGGGAAAAEEDDDDILGIMGAPTASVGGSAAASPPAAPGAVDPLTMPVVSDANGLRIHAGIVPGSVGTGATLAIGIHNTQSSSVDKVAVAVNKNTFGLSPSLPTASFGGVASGASGSVLVDLVPKAERATGFPLSATLDVALRDNTSRVQFIFKVPLRVEATLVSGGGVGGAGFQAAWAAAEASNVEATVRGLASADASTVSSTLNAANVKVLGQRELGDGMLTMLASAKTLAPEGGAAGDMLVELKLKEGFNGARLAVRSSQEGLAQGGFDALQRLLKGE